MNKSIFKLYNPLNLIGIDPTYLYYSLRNENNNILQQLSIHFHDNDLVVFKDIINKYHYYPLSLQHHAIRILVHETHHHFSVLCPQLQYDIFQYCRKYNLINTHLSRFSSMTEINMIPICKICFPIDAPTKEQLIEILSFPQLEVLHLYSYPHQFPDQFPSLTKLSLIKCLYVTPTSLNMILSSCSNLQYLNVSKCYKLRCFDNFPITLQYLNISNIRIPHKMYSYYQTYITNSAIKSLVMSKCHLKYLIISSIHITYLDISKNMYNCTQLLSIIQNCPSLYTIDISLQEYRYNHDEKELVDNYQHPNLHTIICNEHRVDSSTNINLHPLTKYKWYSGGIILHINIEETIYIVLVDMLMTLHQIITKLRNYQIISYDNWYFGRIGLRNNGTTRLINYYQPEQYHIPLSQLLVRKQRIFLLTRHYIDIPNDHILLHVYFWDNHSTFLGYYVVNKSIKLQTLKLYLTSKFFPNIDPQSLSIIEEETNINFHYLYDDDMTLHEYGLISGDLIHVGINQSIRIKDLMSIYEPLLYVGYIHTKISILNRPLKCTKFFIPINPNMLVTDLRDLIYSKFKILGFNIQLHNTFVQLENDNLYDQLQDYTFIDVITP